MPQQRLTNEQKLAICRHRDANPGISQKDLGKWAGEHFQLLKPLTQSAVSKIIQKRTNLEAMDAISLSSKRPLNVRHPLVEEALVFWVLQCQNRKVALSGDLIRNKAERFARSFGVTDNILGFSQGWLQKFQQRHKLRSLRIHGESGSTDMDAMESALPHLQAEIANYEIGDVYNMDETGRSLNSFLILSISSLSFQTGLFYSLTPDKTIAQKTVEGYKKDKVLMIFLWNR